MKEQHKAGLFWAEGLKCDAPGCGYTQSEPHSNDYDDWALWLNAPCPRCGANLLTQADLTTMSRVLKFVKFMNIVLWPITVISHWRGMKRIRYEMGMDGSGKIKPRRDKEAK